MTDLPTDWGALCALVFLLGARHGLDADHLATIDGLTRLGLHGDARRRGARWAGTFFSLGHGAVVTVAVMAVAHAGGRWSAPGWLASLGAAVSIAFLLLLGLANLHGVLSTPHHRVVTPVGVRSRWLMRMLGGDDPAGPSSHRSVPAHMPATTQERGAARSLAAAGAVGALFALSFDTLGMAALLGVAALAFGGAPAALALGASFVAGMLLTDGLNGLWVTRLLARADRRAALASRWMGLAVATISLAVAAFGIARLVSPWVADVSHGNEWMLGATVLAMIGIGSLVANAAGARRRSMS